MELQEENVDVETKFSRKRNISTDDDTEVKRKNISFCGYYIKMLIPSISAGMVLGKGGDIITAIQKKTDCAINLSKGDEFFPGTFDRICIIVGSTENNAKEAFTRISEIVLSKVEADDLVEIKLLVPNMIARLVIGKEGTAIKSLQEDYEVTIQLSKKIEGLPERIISVSGKLDAVLAASKEIVHSISSDVAMASNANISYNAELYHNSDEPIFSKTGILKSSIKLLIPSSMVGNVMGKGGEIIGNIQKETSCRIILSRGTKFYPGSTDRVCLITGPSETNVYNAFKFVFEYCFKRRDSNDRVEVQLLVPNEIAGLVIGKEGTKIKFIQQAHNVIIQLSKRSDQLSERRITITGVLQSILSACKEVICTISTNPVILENTNVNYEDSSSDNQSYIGYRNRVTDYHHSEFENSGGICGSPKLSKFPLKFHLHGNGYPCVIPFDVFDNMMRTIQTEGYMDISAGEICSSIGILAKYGIVTYDPSNSFQNHEVTRIKIDNRADSVEHARKKVKLEMQIPDGKIGAIIGSGGKTLTDIQRNTGATIHISKKGDFAEGTTDRIVTLIGLDYEIDSAKRIIYRNIEEPDYKRSSSRTRTDLIF